MILQLENKLIDVKIRIRDIDAQILSDGTQQPVLDQRLQELERYREFIQAEIRRLVMFAIQVSIHTWSDEVLRSVAILTRAI